ncbi:MAG: class I SAM-dependent methyltransferase [Nitrosomonas sp.]|nr:class I SAM-dependent methyltransferase [Nitrosomonas sp.]
MKAYSEAAERNKQPIVEILQKVFANCSKVLEIGSGTGQHAVFFASVLNHLEWQPTERLANLRDLRERCDTCLAVNLSEPLALDIDDELWPISTVDAVFTANTLHIISWSQVCRLFAKVGSVLPNGGVFCAYGPFNIDGNFTSDSNAHFDAYLRARDAESGIRDLEALTKQAETHHLFLQSNHVLPAYNRILVWHKIVP